MKKYNIQDVVLLDKVYNKLKPWMKDHPSLALFDGRPGCPSCGSAKVQKRGFRVTLAQRKQAYQCRACGAWFEKGSAK
jgi:transcription elongation factor Elf1